MELILKNLWAYGKFDSLTEFVRAMDTLPIPDYWPRRSSDKKSTGDDRFYGTCHSYAQASKLVRQGWPEGVAKLQKSISIVAEGMDTGTFMHDEMDVTGPVAFIGDYLAGDPECMYNPAIPDEQPVLNIIVDMSVHGGVNASYLNRRGAAICSLVESLEAQGRRCNVFCAMVCESWGSEFFMVLIKIKDSHHDLQLNVMAYVLAHPSFYRRHYFRFIELASHFCLREQTPEQKQKVHSQFTSGYGRPKSLMSIEGATNTVGDIDLYLPGFTTESIARYASEQRATQRILELARQAGIIKGAD